MAQRSSEVFMTRLREVRDRRQWSQTELAERMGAAGYPMSRAKIGKLETIQPVDVDDMLALCAVLSVSPLSMIVPLDESDPVALVPSLVVAPRHVREWVRYLNPLATADWRGADDWRIYATEIPDVEQQAARKESRAARERRLAALPAEIAQAESDLTRALDELQAERDERKRPALQKKIERASELLAFKQMQLATGEVPLPMTQHYLSKEDER